MTLSRVGCAPRTIVLTAILRKTERNSLHDTALYYYAARETLQKIIFRGEIGLENRYCYNLRMLKNAVFDLSHIVSEHDGLDTVLLQFKREITALERISTESIAIRKSNYWNVSRHLMETETLPLAKKIIKVMNNLTRDMDNLMIRQATISVAIGKYASLVLSVLFVVMVVAAVIFSRKRAAVLAGPVIALATAANQMAAGTLTEDISPVSDDELGDLTRSFNTMRRELQGV